MDAAELLSVRLIHSEFTVEAEAYQRDKSSWKRSYGCEAQGVAFNAKRDRLSGSVVAEVVCRTGRKRIVVAKCRYLVDYAIKGSPTDTAAETFFGRVGVFAAYPYFRSHFAELTSQAGLLLGPLPVLKESARPMPRAEMNDPADA
ncbi:hypothetical protein [Phenylobacterium soli]|uniref:hypothetical protein n=1 Tax=Phenylobacterium soli TaxID=2170551 RepID=UPI001057A8B3|nr:hypothetical protein [Phenylobacterium soli]